MAEEEKNQDKGEENRIIKIYHFPLRRKETEENNTYQSLPYPEIRRRRSLSQKQRSIFIEAGIVTAIALVLIIIMPALLSNFRLNLLGRFLSLAIAALGIDLIWGYTGLLSLGHGVFFALGGYAIAMHLALQIPPDASSRLPEFMTLYRIKELPWFWEPFNYLEFSLLALLIIPALVAAFIGYLVFRNRIRGVYFSIITQAMTIVFYNFFNGQQDLFNGTNGLKDFKTLLGFNVNVPETQWVFYALTVIFLALIYALCRWLTSGRFGRLLIAIRDDESRVRFSGYNPTGFKVLVFALSGAIAGLAGALYTLQTGLVSPRAMDIAFSIEMVIWVAVGGRATLIGAIVGTLVVNFAKSLLSEQFPDVWLFFQGSLFLLVVMALPNGLVGWWRETAIEWVRSRFGIRRQLMTYPQLETDPEVEREREEMEK